MRCKPLLPAVVVALGLGLGGVSPWQAGAQTGAETAPATDAAPTAPAGPVEDAGFLERQLAKLLGGEGRDVRVIGLKGVLSSQATIERIEVADADGVWLTVRDVALDWRRVALLRRRLEVNALTVGVVEMTRKPLPLPAEAPALAADAQATPFSLPELPVAVDVRQLSVGALRLGEPVLGVPAMLSLSGSARLAGGAGQVALSAVRIDGHESRYVLDAGFENASRQTRVNLALAEAPGGLITTLAGIPGEPSMTLSVTGDAPLSDFTATLALRTDGVDRLAGTVGIRDIDAPGLLTGTEREVTANLSGDVAVLFLPDYRDFFGQSTELRLKALSGTERGLDIETLELTTQGLRLKGTANLNAAFLPEAVDLTASLGQPNGLPVVLPIPGPAVVVQKGAAAIQFDAAKGDGFTLNLQLDGVQRADGVLIDRLALNGDGVLSRSGPTEMSGIAAAITGGMTGFSSTDAALWQAVGDDVTLTGRLNWRKAGALRLDGLDITAGDLGLTGSAVVDGLPEGRPVLTTDLSAEAADLSRFSAISGQTLAGQITTGLKARYDLVSGAFDVALDGKTADLAVGQPGADDLLAGEVTLGLTAARTTEGLVLDRLSVDGQRVTLDGSAAVAPDGFPRRVRLTGRVGATEGAPVALPVPGTPTTLQYAAVDVDYDAARGEGFRVRLDGRDFRQEGVIRLDSAKVTADGTLSRAPEGGVTGAVATFAAEVAGAKAEDPALDAALAGGATLAGQLDWQAAEDRLSLRELAAASGALALNGQAQILGLTGEAPGLSVDGNLVTGPLARFSGLAGTPLTGTLEAKVAARYALATGFFDTTLDGTATDVTVGDAGADALLAGPVALGVSAKWDATGLTIDRLHADGRRIALDGTARLGTDTWPERIDLTGRIGTPGGDPVRLPVPGQTIRLQSADIAARYDAARGDAFTVSLDARNFDQAGGISVGAATLNANGLVRRDAGGLAGASATLTGRLREASAADRGLAQALAPGGDLAAKLDWSKADRKLAVSDLTLTSGDARIVGSGELQRPGAPDMAVKATFDATSGPLSRFAGLAGRRLSGSVSARGTAAYARDTGFFDADVKVTGAEARVGHEQLDQILRGTSEITFKGRRNQDGLTLDTARISTAELNMTATGGVQNGAVRINIDGGLRDLGLFTPDFRGPLTVKAAVTERNNVWSVDGNLTGPGGSQARVTGDVLRPNGTMGLKADGRLPLALVNQFILPRTLAGDARFDLSLNGKPELRSLSGTITVSGARFADPVSRFALEQLALTARLGNERVELDGGANVATGGRIALRGPIGLSGDFPADLAVTLSSVRLENPLLYTIDLGGRVTMVGPLLGGATIGGRIDIDRAELRVPSTLSSGGTILDIRHKGEPGDSRVTRKRAGLLGDDGRTGPAVASGPSYGLDLTISAPNQIYIRGRGLDVELGGEIAIGGTTLRPVPSGGLQLIRGHMDLLARRLQFEEARITMQGDLEPDLYMAATSQNAGVDARIVIQGPITEPEMSFESSPQLPEDEVLAQLFFGRSVQDLSPLQVAQLAAAVNTLTGGDGPGIFGKARQALGVDQLSLGTDDEGNTTVTAGRYLSDKIYSDVTVGEGGRTELQLNYEILPGFSARGSFDSAGNTGLGVVFEKDY